MLKTRYIAFAIALALLMYGCNVAMQQQDRSQNGTEIEISGAGAHWLTLDKLVWNAPENAASFEIRHSKNADITVTRNSVNGGESISLSLGGEFPTDLVDKLRHIATRTVFAVDATTDTASEALKNQIIAIAYDGSGRVLEATKIQPHGVLDDLFFYDGELGPIYTDNEIQVRVWAPTVQSIVMKVYDADKNQIASVDPDSDFKNPGTFQFTVSKEMDRMFYRFDVRVYHPVNGEINDYKVSDPYSVSLSTDSHYSQLVNLSDADLKPVGWDDLKKELPLPSDITLYEAHMRDLSIIDYSIPEEHRGTYKALTHNGMNGRSLSDGMRHLKALSDAGLTHLHLLPINDIRTVNEFRDERVEIFDPYSDLCEKLGVTDLQDWCDEFGDTPIVEVFEHWASEDPATENINKTYATRADDGRRLASEDGFNWGYDPVHFNAPEGSYSTDPEGVTRIIEVREMVQSLHEIGLKTVIDVVYNHTSAAGLDRYSILDRIVPWYYQRLDADSGVIETSTCCPNTAAEFLMKEKLIIDSVVLWAKEYKIDSFRFDLMGHHPKYVMENLQDALAELTLEEPGVDGVNIYIYGEGWNFGEVENDRIFEQATQFNMAGTGIGNFNDRARDAIRGGFHSWTEREQGFANGMYTFPNEDAVDDVDEQRLQLLNHADRIRVGMAGNLRTYNYVNRSGEVVDGGNEDIGFTFMPQETVNYIDKHDNETLWDNTQTKLPLDMGMDERVRIHNLSNSFITFGQGVPFYQLGSDFLRSKSLDRNSYDSGDWYNMVDYTMQDHRWGKGLPPEWDNQDQWDNFTRYKMEANVNVETHHMQLTHNIFKEQLQIRYSSPLFRLELPQQVHRRLVYHNTGPDQIPGVIAMTISDGICAEESLDPNYDGILVIFNADINEQTLDLGLGNMVLHPIQANGSDDVVKQSSAENGKFTVPGLTTAVFVRLAGDEPTEFVCNDLDS